MVVKHNFYKLARTHKLQNTLYCGGLDFHLFNGYDANMAIYGPAEHYYGKEMYETVYNVYATAVSILHFENPADAPKFAKIITLLELYAKKIIDTLVIKCNVRVFKPQAAFYEQFGPVGLILLSRICGYIKEMEKIHDLLINLLDCKRGDISTTQEAYFRALLGDLNDPLGINYTPYGFDIINVTPWMGKDVLALCDEKAGKDLLGLKLMRQGKGIIVVNKSSNPSGPEYQELVLKDGEITLQMKNVHDLYAINQEFDLEYDGLSTIGMVVGSTHECDGSIRKAFPSTTLLVPGFGAQGGKFNKIMKELIPTGPHAGLGAIFSSSRGTMYAFLTENGGSGRVENLEADLIASIASFRKAEKQAYADANIPYPFEG